MKKHIIPFITFGIGLIGALVVWFSPNLHKVLIDISQAGYLGVFLAGMMYGSSFTSSTATIIFAQLPDSLNIVMVAIIGGLGAALYDVLVFILVRRVTHLQRFSAISLRWQHRKIPSWLMQVIGGLIIASPLPDEMASGLLGFSTVGRWRFAMISLIGNMTGIFLIDLIF